MKTKAPLFAVALAALFASMFPCSARAEAEVSFNYFQESLSPYGEWIEVGDYGLCWRPTDVAADWSPYTDGYWAYTDAGWTWVSYEDWGAIVYHYGRWVLVGDAGWVWVPDYDWAPAWVSWRTGDEYVGWAPLPPEARWEESTGLSSWVDASYGIGPGCYRFCRIHDFGAPVLGPVLVPAIQNVTIIVHTLNVTNITVISGGGLIFNGGLNFVTINRGCQRPIPALKLVRGDEALHGGRGHGVAQVLRGNQLTVFAPKVTRPADPKSLPIKPGKIIAAEQVQHGWEKISDPAVKQQIKQSIKMQNQGRTAETMPARPVTAEDLSVAPKRFEPATPRPAIAVKPHIQPPVASNPTRQVLPRPDQPAVPQRPPTGTDRPNVGTPGDLPRAKLNPHEEPAQPVGPVPRVVTPQPFNKPPIERPPHTAQPENPAPVAAPPIPSTGNGAAEKELRRQQREPAITTEKQQADVRRATEAREQMQRQVDVNRQQQIATAQRENELRRQQQQQQREVEMIRQQQASQHANESRQQADEVQPPVQKHHEQQQPAPITRSQPPPAPAQQSEGKSGDGKKHKHSSD